MTEYYSSFLTQDIMFYYLYTPDIRSSSTRCDYLNTDDIDQPYESFFLTPDSTYHFTHAVYNYGILIT